MRQINITHADNNVCLSCGKARFCSFQIKCLHIGSFLSNYKIKVTRFILTPTELSHMVANFKIWKRGKKAEPSQSANENPSAIDVDTTGSTVETHLAAQR